MTDGAHAERDWSAPFGVPVPRPFRKHPREALTAQAYFGLYWWYRGSLIILAGGSAVFVLGFVALLVPLTRPAAAALALSGMTLQTAAVTALISLRSTGGDRLLEVYEHPDDRL